MKPPIHSLTPIKSTTKKATINPITKYFLITKPTSTQHYSKTRKLINEIKNATNNTIRKLRHRIKTPTKLSHPTISHSTFLVRPPKLNLQQLRPYASSSNNSSIKSSLFTSNDCSSNSSQHMSKTHLNPYTTSANRPSKYSSPSSSSSNQLQLDDDSSALIPNIATPLGIQRLITIDSKKQQTDTQPKHSYHYNSLFPSSDSDRYAITKSLQQNPTTPVTTHSYNTPCSNNPPHPITEISIPLILLQPLIYNKSNIQCIPTYH